MKFLNDASLGMLRLNFFSRRKKERHLRDIRNGCKYACRHEDSDVTAGM